MQQCAWQRWHAGAATRGLQQSSGVVVDTAMSTVDTTNLTGPLYAGQWTSFTVQLMDSSGTPVPDVYDAALSVSCSTGAPPPSSSFCYVDPFLLPQGNGLYLVQFMVGTIWCVQSYAVVDN
jgi:hypothetical protein